MSPGSSSVHASTKLQIGPVFWAPWADTKGRRPVFIRTYMLLCLFLLLLTLLFSLLDLIGLGQYGPSTHPLGQMVASFNFSLFPSRRRCTHNCIGSRCCRGYSYPCGTRWLHRMGCLGWSGESLAWPVRILALTPFQLGPCIGPYLPRLV